MSNRPSICWKCVRRENCKMFNKNSEAKVTECGRFLMSDGDKAIMQALYEHFKPESESEYRPDFLRKCLNKPMEKED